MIIVKNLQKNFGENEVFDNANLVIEKGEKIAIIGDNGMGKSTLLNMILGFDDDHSGLIENHSHNMGYMTQHLDLTPGNELFFEAIFFDNKLVEINNKINQLESDMGKEEVYSNEKKYQQILGEYENLQTKFRDLGGFKLEEKGKDVLINLGFEESKWKQKVETLSGGEKTKLKLAKALICESDLLVLDEPTNHLDITNIKWLEDYLAKYKGTLVIISHDKYLLNKVCNYTALVINGKILKYKGNYDDFEFKYKKLATGDEKFAKKIEIKLKRAQNIIRDYKLCFGKLKNRAKNEIRKLKSQLDEYKKQSIDHTKKSSKMRFEVSNYIPLELDDKMIDQLPADVEIEEAQDIDFLEKNKKFIKPLIDVQSLSVKYDKSILDNLRLKIIPGETIAIIGENGKGKTTLMNAIYNVVTNNLEQINNLKSQSDDFSYRVNELIELVYFDQEYKKLNQKKTVMDEMNIDYFDENYQDMRKILSELLFSPAQLKQKVSTLSGGEKAKLNFAKIMLSNYNFMLLDEPTNHLDITTKQILADALRNYDGTILFVSHDREFVEKVASTMYQLKNGKLWPISKLK